MNTLKLFAFVILGFAIGSCETDDVTGPGSGIGPEVTLTLSPLSISENGGTANVTALLSASATSDVTVTLGISGTAIGGGVDYDISSDKIVIPAGSITAAVSITALNDTAKNGNRTVIVDVSQVDGGQFTPQSLTLTIEDDDVPPTLQLIFNEVLYDPSNSGLDGDANGDGVYSQAEDEFLEILNLSSQPADISGFKVFDVTALADDIPRHIFPAGSIIPPGKALVLFGGGTPTGSFGGAVIQTSTTGNMNLNNAGDIVYIFDLNDVELLSFDIEPLSDNPNESYTRNPDITGAFEQHSDNTAVLFSPGTKIDGSPF